MGFQFGTSHLSYRSMCHFKICLSYRMYWKFQLENVKPCKTTHIHSSEINKKNWHTPNLIWVQTWNEKKNERKIHMKCISINKWQYISFHFRSCITIVLRWWNRSHEIFYAKPKEFSFTHSLSPLCPYIVPINIFDGWILICLDRFRAKSAHTFPYKTWIEPRFHRFIHMQWVWV